MMRALLKRLPPLKPMDTYPVLTRAGMTPESPDIRIGKELYGDLPWAAMEPQYSDDHLYLL